MTATRQKIKRATVGSTNTRHKWDIEKLNSMTSVMREKYVEQVEKQLAEQSNSPNDIDAENAK